MTSSCKYPCKLVVGDEIQFESFRVRVVTLKPGYVKLKMDAGLWLPWISTDDTSCMVESVRAQEELFKAFNAAHGQPAEKQADCAEHYTYLQPGPKAPTCDCGALKTRSPAHARWCSTDDK